MLAETRSSSDILTSSPPPASDETRALRHAFGRFTTGVTIVTTQTPQGPIGIAANSFSSVSLDPPLIIWGIGRHSKRFEAFANSSHFAVHVLAAEQTALCQRFARNGHDFSDIALEYNSHGTPLLPGSLARFECSLESRFRGGDHEMLLGRVLRTDMRDGEPIVFSGGRYRRFMTD